MKIDYSAFEKAILQLEISLKYLNSEASQKDAELRNQFRAAVIQAFEFTYELATKMIYRQLKQIVPNPAQLSEMDFMDVMRTAAKAGLIKEAPPFKIYREKRNITSHTYNESKAEEIVAIMDAFLQDVRYIVKELQKRNK